MIIVEAHSCCALSDGKHNNNNAATAVAIFTDVLITSLLDRGAAIGSLAGPAHLHRVTESVGVLNICVPRLSFVAVVVETRPGSPSNASLIEKSRNRKSKRPTTMSRNVRTVCALTFNPKRPYI